MKNFILLFATSLLLAGTVPAAPRAAEPARLPAGYTLETIEIPAHITLGVGGMTFTPKGTPHAFLVVSDTARLLTLQNPGIGQSFYRSASEPTSGDTSETVDIDRIQACATDNPRAIKLLGPPPFARLAVG